EDVADAEVVAGVAPAYSSRIAGFGAVNVNVPDLYDLERNIIADLAFLSECNESLAGFARMVLHDGFEDFVVEQKAVEAIGALQDNVALGQGLGNDVVMAHGFIANAAGQGRTVRAGHGLALEQESQLDLKSRIRMV